MRSMGRDTTGVRGMDVSGKGDEVIAMDVARDDQDLLVVTENGYGKRTRVAEYRKTARRHGRQDDPADRGQGRAGRRARRREHQELVFISQNGMVQRIAVRGINRYGRARRASG